MQVKSSGSISRVDLTGFHNFTFLINMKMEYKYIGRAPLSGSYNASPSDSITQHPGTMLRIQGISSTFSTCLDFVLMVVF